MRYGKRIIAILLAAVLMIGTLPLTALAEEGTEPTQTITEPVETASAPAASETTAETSVPEPTETTGESQPEATVETAPTEESIPETTGETVPETTAETVPETTGETVPETTAETEPETLPYGLPGLPEDYVLSEEERTDKADMISHQVAQQTAALTEGEQYEKDVLLVWAESEETAEIYAAAFSAELLSWQEGMGTLGLQGVSVADALAAAQESDRLPAAYPNHIALLPPEETETAEDSGIALFSADVPQTQTWRSWLDGTENPDALLKDPTAYNYQYMHDTVDSYAAWGVTTGKGVTVAILDSGVMENHEDLPNVERIEVFCKDASLGLDDAIGHGTHVAGIIGAAMGNGVGGAGIAPGVKLLSLRITNDQGSSTDSKLICGLQAAVKAGAQIVNISLGGPAYSAVFQKAINEATEAGVTVVAAMGNDGTNCLNYPAGYDNVIGVVSVDRTGSRASGSTYGTWADVAAPGAVIWSTHTTPRYWRKSGTSMASPVVAGVAALYQSVHPEATPAQITARLKATATKGGSNLGAGIVNAAAALSEKPGTPAAEIWDSETDKLLSQSTGGTLSASWDGQLRLTGGTEDDYLLYTLDGKTPGIREGKVTSGQRYNAPISLTPYAGQTLTVKAMAVNGLGMAGSVLTCRIQVGKDTEIGSVTVSGPTELLAGKTGEFHAQVAGLNPEAPVEQAVTWHLTGWSDNMARASIHASTGKLTTPKLSAGDEGWVELIAISKNRQISSTPFRVTVKALNPVKKISLSARKISCYTGNTVDLDVTMSDFKGNEVTPEVLWSSSKPQVATVADGVITALAKGSTTITCKALDGSGKTAKCTVTVAQGVEGLTITGLASMAPGTSAALKAQVSPKGAVNRLTWSVVDGPAGTRITNGKLYVPKDAEIGETITISAQPPAGGGVGAEYILTVAPKCASVHTYLAGETGYAPLSESYDRKDNLTGLSLYSVQPGEYSKRKDRAPLGATPLDAKGGYLDNEDCIQWSSSNPSVASVTENGFVQAHKAGTAKITAAAQDGSGKKQTVTVKVTNPVSTIALGSSAPLGRMLTFYPLLAAGKSVTHKVTFAETYGRPTNQKITWSWELWARKDSESWNLTADFSRYIGLTTSGRLSIRANASSLIRNYIEAGKNLELTVIAQSQDLSGASATATYLLVPPATKLSVPTNRKTIGIEPGGTREIVFYSDQYSEAKKIKVKNDWVYYDASNFLITSSNPKVASVSGNYPTGCSLGKDGWYSLRIYSTQIGTAKITVKTTDGTNRSCTFTVRSTPKKEGF
ncbi:MAG TPA: hypothetical protein DFH97_06295 [Clostridiales bacterium]|nr:hypothetical protein [Clostridiales bacterium]